MNQLVVPILQTARLRLRQLQEHDAAGLHEAYGDPAAMQFWDQPPSRDVSETLERIRRSIAVDPVWHAAFAVERLADDRFVGMVNYHERRPWNRRLALGWIISPPFWHQGFAQEAVTALLEHCFGALDTHRVEAEIDPENIASIRLAERLGFQREALLRDRMVVAGAPHDVLMYALLRPEWRGAA